MPAHIALWAGSCYFSGPAHLKHNHLFPFTGENFEEKTPPDEQVQMEILSLVIQQLTRRATILQLILLTV